VDEPGGVARDGERRARARLDDLRIVERQHGLGGEDVRRPAVAVPPVLARAARPDLTVVREEDRVRLARGDRRDRRRLERARDQLRRVAVVAVAVAQLAAARDPRAAPAPRVRAAVRVDGERVRLAAGHGRDVDARERLDDFRLRAVLVVAVAALSVVALPPRPDAAAVVDGQRVVLAAGHVAQRRQALEFARA